MSYKVIKAFGSTQGLTKRIFICDSTSDVGNLPTNKGMGVKQENDSVSDEKCAVGSRAEVTETGDIYILSANGEWIAKPGDESGGSDIVIDDTLSQVGQAADAKAVGDALAQKADVSSVSEKLDSSVAESTYAKKTELASYATTANLSEYIKTVDLPKGAAVADATGTEDVVTQLNALISSLKTAGIIATE